MSVPVPTSAPIPTPAPAVEAAAVSPTVSVVVPTRDRPELLERAVRSIIEQDYPGEIEVLVVFDQSEPRPLALDAAAMRSVRSLTNRRTPGLAGGRNTGIVEAGGELVAFCDDDDEWLPDKLRTQVASFVGRPGASAATTGILVDYEGRVVRRIAPAESVTFPMLLRSRLMELHPSTFLARREDLTDGDGLVDEELPGSYAEDYEWLLRRARRGPVVAVPQPLVRVNWHRSSWFTGRWDVIAQALTYLLAKYPEFEREPRGLARIRGQVAFAHAAAGRGSEARRWALRALRLDPLERRSYAALAVSTGAISAERVLALANRFGRGI